MGLVTYGLYMLPQVSQTALIGAMLLAAFTVQCVLRGIFVYCGRLWGTLWGMLDTVLLFYIVRETVRYFWDAHLRRSVWTVFSHWLPLFVMFPVEAVA